MSGHLTCTTLPEVRFAAARRWFEGSSLGRLLAQMKAIDAFNWTTIFGAELLWSVLPLLILVSSLANHRIEDDISKHIGLDRHGSAIVRGLFRESPSHDAFAIVTGLLLSLAGTFAVVGSMQLMYERLFDQEHQTRRDVPRVIAWVLVLLAALAAQTIVRGPVRDAAGTVGEIIVRFVAETLFFWWTMHFLLAGRVPWRVLFPSAVLTAVLWLGLALFSSVFFSSAVVDDSKQYGTIGVVFTFLSWFILIGAVIVFGAALGINWRNRGVSDGPHVASAVDEQPVHHEDVDREHRQGPEWVRGHEEELDDSVQRGGRDPDPPGDLVLREHAEARQHLSGAEADQRPAQ